MSKSEISNEDNPIAFFEYFLTLGFINFRNKYYGINHLHKSGVIDEQDELDNSEANIMGILSMIEEPGDVFMFRDKLNSLLKQELDITINIIKSSYLHFINDEQKHYYSNLLTSRVNNLINRYHASEPLSEYFIPENYLYIILEILKTDTRGGTTASAKSIQNGFSMKKEYYSKIDELYTALVEKNKFIAVKGTKIVFKNAFNGQPLPKKPKLIWLKVAKNHHANKSLLIKFIQYLIADQIIESISDTELKIILPKIFLDKNEKELKNFQQSVAQLSDSNTSDEKMLKDIISKFATEIQ